MAKVSRRNGKALKVWDFMVGQGKIPMLHCS
jgi:hypothetical protein